MRDFYDLLGKAYIVICISAWEKKSSYFCIL